MIHYSRHQRILNSSRSIMGRERRIGTLIEARSTSFFCPFWCACVCILNTYTWKRTSLSYSCAHVYSICANSNNILGLLFSCAMRRRGCTRVKFLIERVAQLYISDAFCVTEYTPVARYIHTIERMRALLIEIFKQVRRKCIWLFLTGASWIKYNFNNKNIENYKALVRGRALKKLVIRARERSTVNKIYIQKQSMIYLCDAELLIRFAFYCDCGQPWKMIKKCRYCVCFFFFMRSEIYIQKSVCCYLLLSIINLTRPSKR